MPMDEHQHIDWQINPLILDGKIVVAKDIRLWRWNGNRHASSGGAGTVTPLAVERKPPRPVRWGCDGPCVP